MWELLVGAGFAVLAVVLTGPRFVRTSGREIWQLLVGRRWILGLSLLAPGALWLCARSYVPVSYLAEAVASCVSFASLFLLCKRFSGLSEGIFDRVMAAPVALWLVLFFLAAVLANQLVLENIPHTSDEVAYQFQARCYAQGKLGFEPPPEESFFKFTHISTHGGIWHGIMNPGWPALLALGYAAHLPWLVNPLLATLALLLWFLLLRRWGLGQPLVTLATLFLAISPFYLFMAGTFMAHSANFFLLMLFLWAYTRAEDTGRWWPLLVAGLALAINLPVRPLDAALTAGPFGALLAWRCCRQPSWIPKAALLGLVAFSGAVALGWYNQQLTGEARVFPQELDFQRKFPGQGFGLGFGDNMGSKLHGPEWPGYYLEDAPRVSSHRLLLFLKDVHALPVVLLAALLFALVDRPRLRGYRPLLWAALLLFGIYVAHFYHGIAYGSRHYFMALPAVILMLVVPAARLLSQAGTATMGRALTLALLLHTVVFAFPPLIREYGSDYRLASGALRRAAEQAQLSNALVFVASQGWGWKSGFPLNEYPLESSEVIFARNEEQNNLRLIQQFPERRVYLARKDADAQFRLQEVRPEQVPAR
jgi:hypothetical protein